MPKLNKKFYYYSLFLVVILHLYLFSTIFKEGFPSGHDVAPHLIDSKIFIESLQEGQFPVRWVNWVTEGVSFPLFNFYQVGFYYLVFLFNLLIPSVYGAIKLALLFLWWLAAFFVFLFCKRFGLLQATLSTLVFSFSPYIISDIFVRAAYGELMAITFVTGVFWAADRLAITGKSIYLFLLSIFLGITTLSHLPTLLIFTPILVFYQLLLFHYQEAKFINIYKLLISVVLGIGLASFYLLPAIFELNLIQSRLLTAAEYSFTQHFVFFEQLIRPSWGYGLSRLGLNDQMSFQIGIVHWVFLILTWFFIISTIFFKEKVQQILGNFKLLHQIFFWGFAALYSIFFIQEGSRFLWDKLPPLQFVQYPWRFLMVISFSTAILSGILLNLVKNIKVQSLTVIIIGLLIFGLHKNYLSPLTFLPENYFAIDSSTWRESRGVIKHAFLEQGYLPKTVKKIPREKVEKWQVLQGHAQINPRLIKTTQLNLEVISTTGATLRINTPNFEGWEIYIDKQEQTLKTDKDYGYMIVDIPAGSHSVETKFTNTAIRLIANSISILSLVVLGLLTVIVSFRKLDDKIKKI